MNHLSPDSRTSAPSARKGSAATGRIFLLTATLAVWGILGLSGCMTDSGKDDRKAQDTTQVGTPRIPMVFALASDRKTTGNFAVIGLDSAFKKTGIETIHSDAVVRYLGGDDIFIINRMNRDNLQVISRHNFKTVLQVALPALSNPQDVAIKDSLIYVAFMSLDKIGVFHQRDGKSEGEIDISAFADASDQLAEAIDLLFIGADLYVLTQNLDAKNGWVPLTAHLLKIDVAGKKVVNSLDLPYGNPAAMTYDSASGSIYIPCRGEYANADWSTKTDGAIIAVKASSLETTDTLATEKDLGGNVNEVFFYKGKLYMDLSEGASEKILAIGLTDGKAVSFATFGAYEVGGMALDAKTATLFVSDRKKDAPRLRSFNLETLKENVEAALDLGLPPSDLAIIR